MSVIPQSHINLVKPTPARSIVYGTLNPGLQSMSISAWPADHGPSQPGLQSMGYLGLACSSWTISARPAIHGLSNLGQQSMASSAWYAVHVPSQPGLQSMTHVILACSLWPTSALLQSMVHLSLVCSPCVWSNIVHLLVVSLLLFILLHDWQTAPTG